MLIRLVPGDPIEVRVGRARHRARAARAMLRHEFGLDQPLWKQFLDYEWQVLHGDLGVSVVTHESVWTRVHRRCSRRRSNSSICAMLFAIVLGMPLGVIAAVKRGSAFDYGADGPLRDRRLDADLLVGADDDPALLGAARLDAGFGPHRATDLLRRAA